MMPMIVALVAVGIVVTIISFFLPDPTKRKAETLETKISGLQAELAKAHAEAVKLNEEIQEYQLRELKLKDIQKQELEARDAEADKLKAAALDAKDKDKKIGAMEIEKQEAYHKILSLERRIKELETALAGVNKTLPSSPDGGVV